MEEHIESWMCAHPMKHTHPNAFSACVYFWSMLLAATTKKRINQSYNTRTSRRIRKCTHYIFSKCSGYRIRSTHHLSILHGVHSIGFVAHTGEKI